MTHKNLAKTTDSMSGPPQSPSVPGEGATKEEEDMNPRGVATPPPGVANIQTTQQTELFEAQSKSPAAEERLEEEMKSNREEINLFQQRRDQLSDRVADTSISRISAPSVLRNTREKLQAEMQTAMRRIRSMEDTRNTRMDRNLLLRQNKAGRRQIYSDSDMEAAAAAASSQVRPSHSATLRQVEDIIEEQCLNIMRSMSSMGDLLQECTESENTSRGSSQAQNRNPSNTDTADVQRKLLEIEKQLLDLASQRNREKFHCEKEKKELHSEIERRKAVRRRLEQELSAARKECQMQRFAAEEELSIARRKHRELQALIEQYQQKLAEAERSTRMALQKWEEEKKKCAEEKDEMQGIIQDYYQTLMNEKIDPEKAAQLRIREDALSARKVSPARVSESQRDFRESASARERGVNVFQRGHFPSSRQVPEMAEEKKNVLELSGRQGVPTDSSRVLQEERSLGQLSSLRRLCQHLVERRVLPRQQRGAIESLSQAELCALLFNSIDALLSDFMSAQDRISRLEQICKEKTDTLRDLRLSHEEAFITMSERLKAQEENCEKEKRHLELQYSSLIAEARAKAQEHQEAAQKTMLKINALEKAQENLARENASLKNALANAEKECLSLLAACGLLAGALCPLYSRLHALSSQRDLLQSQVNTYEGVNQKIRVILDALPAEGVTNQGEARPRQRRGKALVYVFRRDVIAVLAANRLRVLARCSTTIFTWTSGVEGGSRIQVCVGECHGQRDVSCYTDQRTRCLETVGWLTSCNVLSAISSSLSEIQNILNPPDPNSRSPVSSIISAARNCFARLMDMMNVMLGTVPPNQPRSIICLERDSLMQRLARGLARVNTQALQAGLTDRLPITRNVASLQQVVLEYTRKLHVAEAECCSLRLQLADYKWNLSMMKRGAERAQSLQQQFQHSLPETASEMRRVRVLDPQRLRTPVEQDRRGLQEGARNAERALIRAERDREFIIKRMKAVETTLREVRDQALMPRAAAGTRELCLELPRLQIETLTEKEMRGRPEAAALQDMIRTFMDIYKLAAARIETLLRKRSQVRPATQRPRSPTPAPHGSCGTKRDAKQPRSSKLHSDTDQSDRPRPCLLPTESEMSSSMTSKRASTRSPTYMSSTVTSGRDTTESSTVDKSSTLTSGTSITESTTVDTSSTLTSGTSITESTTMDTSSTLTSGRGGTESSTMDTSSTTTMDESGTWSTTDISSSTRTDGGRTTSTTDISSGILQDRSRTTSTMDISSGTLQDGGHTTSTMDISSGSIFDGHRTTSTMDISSGSILPGHHTTSTMDISSGSIFPGHHTTSTMDISSGSIFPGHHTTSTMDISSGSIFPGHHTTSTMDISSGSIFPGHRTTSTMDISSGSIFDGHHTTTTMDISSGSIFPGHHTTSTMDISSGTSQDGHHTTSTMDISSGSIFDGHHTTSTMDISSGSIFDGHRTTSTTDISSGTLQDGGRSTSTTDISSGSIFDGHRTTSTTDISSGTLQDGGHSTSTMDISSGSIFDGHRTTSTMDISSGSIFDGHRTTSTMDISSGSIFPGHHTTSTMDISSGSIFPGHHTTSTMDISSGSIFDGHRSTSTMDISSGTLLDGGRTTFPSNMSPSMFSHSTSIGSGSFMGRSSGMMDRSSVESSMLKLVDALVDAVFNVVDKRFSGGSSMDTFSSVTTDRGGTASSMDTSSGMMWNRSYPMSPSNISSSVLPHRSNTSSESLMDISSGMMLDRSRAGSSVDTLVDALVDAFHNAIQNRLGGGSSVDTFSSVTPTKTNATSSLTPTNWTSNTDDSLPSVHSFSLDVLSSTRSEGN